jgi:hypothetical protein
MRLLFVVLTVVVLGLAGCSSDTPNQPTTPTDSGTTPKDGTQNPTNPNEPINPTTPGLTPTEAQAMALNLWRNTDLSKHPKGSCAGCHGADFFDLARIGSTDADLMRRAMIDGATQQEADALVMAVRQMREDFKLPATNARTFRPFQPSGSVLLPGLTDAPHVQAVKRDIAFGEQLEQLLPTLYGERVDSLADAKKARDELLDLAEGTNRAGANPTLLNLRSLPTGITYPLWSADVHHSPIEGTLNDWVADVAHDAKPERRAEWLALQDAYLADPSNENFWKMYYAATDMTATPLLGSCTVDGINPHLACAAVKDFNKHKFLSALIGQHMLRLEALNRDDFLEDGLAFAYLDTDPRFAFMNARKDPEFLPADMWEIGDRGRVMLEDRSQAGTFKQNLQKLGYPEFVQDSIDPERSEATEQHQLRLAWFWIGFTFDPSFARIHASNATKVGEYMVGTLMDERMFIHNAFQTNMRLVTKGYLQEANAVSPKQTVTYTPPVLQMNYRYFWGYNRTVLDTKWNENKTIKFPADLKAESTDLFHRLTANGFRMSMYLYMEALDNGADRNGSLSDLTGAGTGFYSMKAHFDAYEPEHQTADYALMDALKAKLGVAY